jgi:CRP-like cAMP-binding protein
MLTTVDKVLFLLRSPVTMECTTDALSRLAGIAREVDVALGERPFRVGDPAEAMFVVLDGALRVEGIEVPSRLASAGDFVGGLSLFAGGTHLAGATAVVTSRVLRIDRGELHDLLDEDGEFARALFTGLVRALRTTMAVALAAST